MRETLCCCIPPAVSTCFVTPFLADFVQLASQSHQLSHFFQVGCCTAFFLIYTTAGCVKLFVSVYLIHSSAMLCCRFHVLQCHVGTFDFAVFLFNNLVAELKPQRLCHLLLACMSAALGACFPLHHNSALINWNVLPIRATVVPF